ncbi:hypothetical protein VTN77DRAFT_294 [Rasamsonia byssochlamydoides]|uniref:uncharacterized protein n=1 Tax=Rasamsonia byssochlamydoides TaxID=89139 RepID=UPI003743BAE4
MNRLVSAGASLRVALEGCGHGKLHDIYAAVEHAAKTKGWDGVDLVIIGGDFQAVRNSYDLTCMQVPQKYREIGDFHEYYSGKRTAPYLTLFIGGNHEASNHLFELYYGGWVAPNIYYMGAANVLRCGPLRIAGLSGIWKGYDYRKPHFERLPYNSDDIQSIYHVRELDVRKLLQIRTQVDLGLSHDWPKKVEYCGDHEQLFRTKQGFREDSQRGRLGSTAAKHVLDRLRPRYWFSAHLHVKFAATIAHGKYIPPENGRTNDRGLIQENTPKVPYTCGLDGASVSIESGPLRNENSAEGDVLEKTVADLPDSKSVASEIDQMIGQDNTVSKPSRPLESPSVSESGLPQTSATAENVISPSSIQSNDLKSPISAWQNFHAVAAKQEAQDYQRYLQEMQEHQTTRNNALEANHQLTWRKVNVGEDMTFRKVTGVRKTGFSEESESKRPKVEQTTAVKNSDEIDLDLSSDDGSPEDNATTDRISAQKDATQKAHVIPNAETNTPAASIQSPKQDRPKEDEEVSQDLRQQLPASFQQPSPAAHDPLPEAISNTETQFLALDKCLPGRKFLQLVEFTAISDQDGVQQDRPYRLQYDKEWLAITRVFADDLTLGDPTATPPPDKGERYYKQRIMEEEQWIEEHVVKAGKMTVPDNFTITAPVYDPSVPITTTVMPPEYNNPQTAEFCNLIGIENKFHQTDEERQARIAAGPRPSTERNFHHGRSGGSGRFGPRNGGRGWHGGGGGRGGSSRGRGGHW